jgi:hypothetical protein
MSITIRSDELILMVEACGKGSETFSITVVRAPMPGSRRWKPWRGFIGEPFGWGWITINQQDALDGILISFAGITPQLMLNVMASSIEEGIIHQSSEKSV